MENQTFGDRVKKLRKSKNMSMEELAKAVNTTKSSVNMWENANAIPRETMLLELSKTLNVSIDFLLGNKELNIWGFHNKNYEEILLNNSVIAIGWQEMGDLSTVRNEREVYYDLYKRVYPDSTKRSVATSASILYRFVHEAKVGDYVVYPTRFNRMVNIGIIEGEYFFNEHESQYPQQKKVKWLKQLPRTDFSQGALYEMGSYRCFFKIKNYADEILILLNKNEEGPEILSVQEDDSIDTTAEAILENTKDYILKEIKERYQGYDFETLISKLLNTMNYETQISTHKGERDIVAYKDGLPPRNIVRVKGEGEEITPKILQAFKIVMQEGDSGVFVTLSNLSTKAQKFLESEPRIRVLDSNGIAELILKNYDKMPEIFRETIKLKKVLVPVIENEE